MSLLASTAICWGFQLTSASSSSSAVAIRSVAAGSRGSTAASSAVTVSSFLTTLAGTLLGNTSCSHGTGRSDAADPVRVPPIRALGRLQAACSLANRWMLQLRRCTRCSKVAARRSHLPLGAEQR
jgi:type IV secretory pathway TrbL component